MVPVTLTQILQARYELYVNTIAQLRADCKCLGDKIGFLLWKMDKIGVYHKNKKPALWNMDEEKGLHEVKSQRNPQKRERGEITKTIVLA